MPVKFSAIWFNVQPLEIFCNKVRSSLSLRCSFYTSLTVQKHVYPGFLSQTFSRSLDDKNSIRSHCYFCRRKRVAFHTFFRRQRLQNCVCVRAMEKIHSRAHLLCVISATVQTSVFSLLYTSHSPICQTQIERSWDNIPCCVFFLGQKKNFDKVLAKVNYIAVRLLVLSASVVREFPPPPLASERDIITSHPSLILGRRYLKFSFMVRALRVCASKCSRLEAEKNQLR